MLGPALKRGAKLHGAVQQLTSHGTVVLGPLHEKWGGAAGEGLTEVKADAVICATGYLYSFPFLRRSGLEQTLCGDGTSMRHLYRRVFYSRNASLGFIGMPNVLLPPWVVFDQQARWLAGVWSGSIGLPSEDEMEVEASSRHMEQPTPHAKRDNLFLGTPAYCNELAQLTGSPGYYSSLIRTKFLRILASAALGTSDSLPPARL